MKLSQIQEARHSSLPYAKWVEDNIKPGVNEILAPIFNPDSAYNDLEAKYGHPEIERVEYVEEEMYVWQVHERYDVELYTFIEDPYIHLYDTNDSNEDVRKAYRWRGDSK